MPVLKFSQLAALAVSEYIERISPPRGTQNAAVDLASEVKAVRLYEYGGASSDDLAR